MAVGTSKRRETSSVSDAALHTGGSETEELCRSRLGRGCVIGSTTGGDGNDVPGTMEGDRS